MVPADWGALASQGSQSLSITRLTGTAITLNNGQEVSAIGFRETTPLLT